MDAETLRKEIAEQVQTDFESQVRELRRQKNNAEEALDEAGGRWRLERRKLKSEIEQLEEGLAAARAGKPAGDGGAGWEQEREQLKARITMLEATLAENIAQLEQLRRDYEVKIEALAQQNEKLRRELETATGQGTSIVGAVEVRLQPDAESASIEAEMQRVEAAIRAIETLLEHPSTTASMMARKNTERAENEAYLRGLTFRLVRAKGA